MLELEVLDELLVTLATACFILPTRDLSRRISLGDCGTFGLFALGIVFVFLGRDGDDDDSEEERLLPLGLLLFSLLHFSINDASVLVDCCRAELFL